MSTNALDDQFSDYTPEVSDKEVASALKMAKPIKGIYKARVVGGARQISDPVKSGKGKVMFVEEYELLRPSDDAVSATTVKKWHILPIPPRENWLIAAGYDADKVAGILQNFDADGKKKMWLNKWRSRLRAGFGKTAYPDYPRPVEGSGYTQFTLADGSTVDKETAETAKGELIRAVKLSAHNLLKDTSATKGQVFYIKIDYETDKDGKEKSDFPSVEWFSATPPVDEKTEQPLPVLDPFTSVK